MLRELLPIFLLCSSISPLKILGYNPTFGHSHTVFIGKIADILADEGHEVVLITSIEHADFGKNTTRSARVLHIEQSDAGKKFQQLFNQNVNNMWQNEGGDIFEMKTFIDAFMDMFEGQCKRALTVQKDMIMALRKEKFDMAFSEGVDACGFAIFHLLGINKYALTHSLPTLDGVFDISGMPSFPSFIPGLWSTETDVMSFSERVNNFIAMGVSYYMHYRSCKAIDLVTKELYGNFPSSSDLMVNATFYFVNSEPFIAFPRPITNKFIDIGGISASTGHKPLDEKWQSIVSRRKKTVLISFGTVALSHMMPAAYKQTIRKAIKRFPDVTFIWKYEKEEDNMGEGLDNAIIAKWVPQNDLLKSGRLSAFVTHGGAGSVMESSMAGVPTITIPVLVDQFRNAHQVERMQTSIFMLKEKLATPGPLIGALKELLESDTYLRRARHVAATIAERPFSMKELLLRHFEFVAKFGPMPSLNPHSRHLSFVQLYSVDVIAFLFSILLIPIVVLYFIVRTILGCLRVKKPKRD